jgi:hypothetical protein
MREQEKIAGEKMEEHDVIRARQAARGRVQAVLRLDAPRRLELGFDIDRAVEPDGGKNVGQGVHQKNLPGLFYALRRRSASQLAMRRRVRPCALRSTRPMFMNPWMVPS